MTSSSAERGSNMGVSSGKCVLRPIRDSQKGSLAMANQETSPGFLNGVWSFFASVKLTVVVLLTLAATSIIGTVIPQNESPAAYISTYGEKLYRLFSFLDIFDMYHSWWFQLVLLVLTANVAVCSLERLPKTWKVVSVKEPSFNLGRFRGDSNRQEFETERPAQSLKELFEPFLCKQYGYCRVDDSEKGWVLFAEKGRWTRLGAYIVHLSLVFLLVGGLVGSWFGFEGFVNIPEGESVKSIRLRNQNAIQPLDFEIRCDDFQVSFYESGSPKEYRSTLTLIEDGKPVRTKDIIVNDPLRYGGINIFQSSYGSLPSDTVTLSIASRDDEFGFNFIKKAKVGEPVELPEGKGTFVLRNFSSNADFRGHAVGEAYVGELAVEGKEPVEILLPLRFPSFDRMRQGEFVISVEKYDERFYTGLQVTKDPGVPVVYAGFIVMILGCFITFFASHQRLCVEIVRKGGKSLVMVAGSANKNKLGMQRKIEAVSKKLRTMAQSGS